MKIRIISFVLSLVFTSTLIFQNIGYIPSAENSPTSKVEYKTEKRMIEVTLEDTYLLVSNFITSIPTLKSTRDLYKHKIYAFKLNHSLFKPPIFL